MLKNIRVNKSNVCQLEINLRKKKYYEKRGVGSNSEHLISLYNLSAPLVIKLNTLTRYDRFTPYKVNE